MPQLTADNLIPWFIQVAVVASLGALLPAIFRLRHPRSQLIYLHAVLLASIALPFVQPLGYPISVALAAPETAAPPATLEATARAVASALPWGRIAGWILLSGFAVRLSWLGVGLWRLRRYRRDAVKITTLPEPLTEARELTGANATFCISPGSTSASGPMAFGWLRPMIVFPESFLSLPAESQRGIACHELIHVRRRDWLMILAVELAGAFFWFHPAVWWLLDRMRLARERVVDTEVVRLTGAREQYIDALLAMAKDQTGLDFTAPSFLGRRHMAERLRALLSQNSSSRKKLSVSYIGMALTLGLAALVSCHHFPLLGPDILHRYASAYPDKFEGTVVVTATLDDDAKVIGARVVSGPVELRKAAMNYILGNPMEPAYRSQILPIAIDFKRPAVDQRTLSSEAYGKLEIDYTGLPEPIRNAMRRRVQRFESQPLSNPVMQQIDSIVKQSSAEMGAHVRAGWNGKNGNPLLILYRPDTPNPGVPWVSSVTQATRLLYKVEPVYPPVARNAGIEGSVTLGLTIAKSGNISAVVVHDSRFVPLILERAAVDAVKQWVFEPTFVNGQAIDLLTDVSLSFGADGIVRQSP